jgi:hypothetical protein
MSDYRNLFDMIIAEYIAIVSALLQKYPVNSGVLLISRNTLTSFLDKNKYLQSAEKLRIYKQFNMIITTGEGVSRVIYDTKQKKSVRKIALNISTYEKIKHLTRGINN